MIRPRAALFAAILLAAPACGRGEARTRYEQGVRDMEKGRIAEALAGFEVVLDSYPDTPWAEQARERLAQVRRRGEELRAEGLALEATNAPAAREKLRLADAVLGKDRAVLEALVRLASDSGDRKGAKDYANRLVAAYPNEVVDPWIYVVVARGEEASYNPVLADKALEKAERLAERLGRPELLYLVRVERFQFHARTGDAPRRIEAAERILADFPSRAEEAGVPAFYRSAAVPYAAARGAFAIRARPEAGAPVIEEARGAREVPVVFTRAGWARVIAPSGRLGFAPLSEITNRPFALLDARARWLRDGSTGLLLPAVGFRVRNTGEGRLANLEIKADFTSREGEEPPRDLGAEIAAEAVGEGGLPPGAAGAPIVLSAARGVRLGAEGGAPELGARLYYRRKGAQEWTFAMRVAGDRVEEIGKP